jgi:hypothetical protein
MDVFDLAADVLTGTGQLMDALALIRGKDDVIRAAYKAGFCKMDLHKRTGLARSTIDRILSEDPTCT